MAQGRNMLMVAAGVGIAAAAGVLAWAGVLPEPAAVLALVGAACMGTYALAGVLRLDERLEGVLGFGRMGAGVTAGPEEVLSEIRRCAEEAARGGVMHVRAAGPEAKFPGLREGLRRAAAGEAGEAIRRWLEVELEEKLAERARGTRDGRNGAVIAAVGLAVVCAGVVVFAQPAVVMPGWIGGAIFVGMLGGVVALSARPMARGEAQRWSEEGREVLARTMIACGVAAIAAGRGPREVEREVMALLPRGGGEARGVASEGAGRQAA